MSHTHQRHAQGPEGGAISRADGAIIALARAIPGAGSGRARRPPFLGDQLDPSLGKNLLRLLEVRAPHLHTDAADGAIQVPGLHGHVLVGDEALDALRLQPAAQKLGSGQLANAGQGDDILGIGGLRHGRTLARTRAPAARCGVRGITNEDKKRP